MSHHPVVEKDTSGPQTSVPYGHGVKIVREVHVNRPPQQVYEFWRNIENLPRIMSHLESVEPTGPGRSRWTAKGPLGSVVEWEAEIHNEVPGEILAWRSLPGSDVDTAGSVHFDSDGSGGTRLTVVLKYDPPGGKAGIAVAKLLGEDPEKQIDEDLRGLASLLDGGVPGTPPSAS